MKVWRAQNPRNLDDGWDLLDDGCWIGSVERSPCGWFFGTLERGQDARFFKTSIEAKIELTKTVADYLLSEKGVEKCTPHNQSSTPSGPE